MYLKIQNLLGKCLIEFMIKHLFLHLTSQVLVQPTPSVAWFSNATTAVLLSTGPHSVTMQDCITITAA